MKCCEYGPWNLITELRKVRCSTEIYTQMLDYIINIKPAVVVVLSPLVTVPRNIFVFVQLGFSQTE